MTILENVIKTMLYEHAYSITDTGIRLSPLAVKRVSGKIVNALQKENASLKAEIEDLKLKLLQKERTTNK